MSIWTLDVEDHVKLRKCTGGKLQKVIGHGQHSTHTECRDAEGSTDTPVIGQ